MFAFFIYIIFSLPSFSPKKRTQTNSHYVLCHIYFIFLCAESPVCSVHGVVFILHAKGMFILLLLQWRRPYKLLGWTRAHRYTFMCIYVFVCSQKICGRIFYHIIYNEHSHIQCIFYMFSYTQNGRRHQVYVCVGEGGVWRATTTTVMTIKVKWKFFNGEWAEGNFLINEFLCGILNSFLRRAHPLRVFLRVCVYRKCTYMPIIIIMLYTHCVHGMKT